MELSNIDKEENPTVVENPLEISISPPAADSTSKWKAHMDEGSGTMYYANEATGETTWDKNDTL